MPKSTKKHTNQLRHGGRSSRQAQNKIFMDTFQEEVMHKIKRDLLKLIQMIIIGTQTGNRTNKK